MHTIRWRSSYWGE